MTTLLKESNVWVSENMYKTLNQYEIWQRVCADQDYKIVHLPVDLAKGLSFFGTPVTRGSGSDKV